MDSEYNEIGILSVKTSNKLFNLIWRQTLFAMVMMILSNIGAVLMDGVITTRVFGANASAAMGLITPYVMLVSLIGGLIGTGCQTLCSKAMGNGDRESSDRAAATSFYFGIAVSLVLTAVIFIFARPICGFIGASGKNAELLDDTKAYMRGVSVGTVGMVLNIILSPVVQLYAGRRAVNRSVIVIFVADVVFDLLAVILGIGILGIGLATSLSTFLGTFVLLKYAFSDKVGMKLSPRNFSVSDLKPILKQGTPEAVKRFVRLGQDVLSNYLILLAATGAAMAGKTVGNLLASFLSVLGLGAASAMYLLSGVYTAMEDEESLILLGKRQIRMLVLTAALTLLSFIFAPQLTALMLNADAETRQTAVIYVRCILVQIPLYICFEMVTYYLQNIGHGRDANLISLFGSIVFYLPLVFFMKKLFGAPGVVLSVPAALLLTLAVSYIRLCLRLHRIASLRDILHVSECINVSGIDVLDRSTVRNLEESVRCSEKLRLALLEKGSDTKTAYAVSLFAEEICSNIIIHGFTKQKRLKESSKFASVFAYIENDTVTLRIADNCALFDPEEKLRTLEETQSKPESGLGLKLVFSMADEASYTSMLNMNHMLIRVPMHSAKQSSLNTPKKLEFIQISHPG